MCGRSIRGSLQSVRRTSTASASEFVDDHESGRGFYRNRDRMTLSVKSTFLLSSSASLLLGLGGTAMSQTAAPTASGTTGLPRIEVVEPRRVQPTRRPKARVTTPKRRETPAAPPQTQAQGVAGQNTKFHAARHTIFAPIHPTPPHITPHTTTAP